MLFRDLDLGPADEPRTRERGEVVEVLTAAIRGSDAYAAVRRAVKLEDGVLRVGNRFVKRAKLHEVAFLAVGNASGAMAHGLHDALGEVVTQGLVGGPIPPPEPWPFLYRKLTDPTFPSSESAAFAAEAVEMAEGLGPKDLFVPLISPGALGMIGSAPTGGSLPEYAQLLREVAARPGGAAELPVVAAALSPVQGGGLASAAQKVPTEALLVDPGEGGRALGAGPTVPRDPALLPRARALLERLHLLDRLPARTREALVPGGAAPRAVGRDLHNVVVASPADALETAGAEAAYRKHRARLVALHDPSEPEVAADHLLAAVEKHAPRGPLAEGEGVALFCGLSLDLPEGAETREALGRFLLRAQAGLPRRGVTVAVLSTAGSLREESTPSGGMVEAQGSFSLERFRRPSQGVLDLAPGFTDVGTVAVAYLTGRGASKR